MDFGIVEGLDHLHTASQNPIIHGNLKTNNIMLDADFQPGISDFGLYLLNPAAAQEMLETSAMQGYRGTRQIRKNTQFIVYSPVKTQSICLASVALLKIKISRFAWPFMFISFYFLLGMMYYLDCKKLQSNGKSYSVT